MKLNTIKEIPPCKLYKFEVFYLEDLFTKRWIILDMPKDCPLYRQYFWTRKGALKAYKKFWFGVK